MHPRRQPVAEQARWRWQTMITYITASRVKVRLETLTNTHRIYPPEVLTKTGWVQHIVLAPLYARPACMHDRKQNREPIIEYRCLTPHAGVDLQALEKCRTSDRDSGLVSNESSGEQSSESGWMPDWTRSALDEVFGPLAETATMLYMSRGQPDDANVNNIASR